jgi:hypothetical protein
MDNVHFLFNGLSFSSLGTAQAYIDTINHPSHRFEAQQKIARQAFRHVNQIADEFETYMGYVERDYARQDVFQSEEDFYAEFEDEFRFVRRHAKDRDRREEARQRIERSWYREPDALAWFRSLPAEQQQSKSFLESLSTLAASESSWDTARSLINFSMYERLANPGKGKRRLVQVMTVDLHIAKRRRLAENERGRSLEIPRTWLDENSLSLGNNGLLQKSPGQGKLETSSIPGMVVCEDGSNMANQPEEKTVSCCIKLELSNNEIIRNELTNFYDSRDIGMCDGESDVSVSTPGTEADGGKSLMSPQDVESSVTSHDTDHEGFGILKGVNKGKPSIGDESKTFADFEIGSESNWSPSDAGSSYESADSDSEADEKRRQRDKPKQCSCSSDVTPSWMDRVRHDGSRRPLAEQRRSLQDMMTFRRVCYQHLKCTASIVGLNLLCIKTEPLLDRLKFIHERWDQLDNLKRADDTFQWFRMNDRPKHSSDELSIYKFRAKTQGEFSIDTNHLEQVLGSILGCSDMSSEFQKSGTVNLPVFTWIAEDEEINQIIDEEFNMYRYHLREKNGRPNYGWCRVQVYSLIQQLIRQDPVYWMLYCLLRPDHHWRLVTYPYYTKYAVLADGKSTYFRHIDLNMDKAAADGQGTNMIQGSVSLDDEHPDGGTEMLLGLHKCFREWWSEAKTRGVTCPPTQVARFIPEMFTPADEEKYKCRWTICNCRKGEARISLPTIPHGANETRSARRRTVLPWFVALRDDLSSLEMPGSGTWSDLAMAHARQIAPPKSPSGFPNIFGKLPGRFPGSVQLDGLGSISDALVCRKSWDDPTVLAERDLLLQGNVSQVREYVDNWRKNAAQAIKRQRVLVRQEEQRAFGDRSFFKVRETGLSLDELWNMPPDM